MEQYYDLVAMNESFRGQLKELVKYRYLLQNLVVRVPELERGGPLLDSRL